MERIKAALERAKESQGGTISKSFFGEDSQPFSQTSDINYVQTRTVKVAKKRLHDHRIITTGQNDKVADAIKLMRTQVLQRLRDNNWNSVAVTSPNSGEGKTVLALNLAISLASEVNATVLLVDADLRNPGIHKLLDVPVSAGLSDYLMKDTPLSEILFHPMDMGRLVILPGNQPVRDSSEMLNSPKMSNLVEELKSRYPERVIIYDVPPVLTSADALSFSPHVDATLLVTEERRTRIEDMERAIDLLAPNTKILGTLLNKSMRTQSGDQINTQAGWLSRLFGKLR